MTTEDVAAVSDSFMYLRLYVLFTQSGYTLSALIFEGLNFRVTKISRDLIREIWLNPRKFAKYKSRKISQKLQTAKIAKLNYHETMKLPIKGISN